MCIAWSHRREPPMRALAFLTIIIAWATASSATAETSVALVKKDIRGQYQLMKHVYANEMANAAKPGTGSRPKPKESYDLVSCAPADPEISSRDNLTTDIARLAAEIWSASGILDWIGYPKSLWETSLANYEKMQLDRIAAGRRFSSDVESNAAEPLIKRLNEFGKRSKPRLAEVAWDTACGGTGHELTLVTDPPKGKVRIWPALYHAFCSAQGVKADSVRECNQWIEIADGEADLFSGAYWFQASWQNGPTVQGRKDISRLPDRATQWIVRQSGN